MININQLKKLREETEISLAGCKKALEEAGGDIEKAKEILRKRGVISAQKKAEKTTEEGIIESYIHSNGRIGVLIDLRCETDFVARSEEFRKLAHELCLQIAATSSQEKNSFLSEPWIRDESKTVKDLISEYIAKLGENIVVKRFVRYEI